MVQIYIVASNLIKRQKYFSTVPVDGLAQLTQRGRVRLICVSKLIIIGSDNGLAQARYQAIIWISAGILLIGSLGRNSSENLIKIYKFSFQGVCLKMPAGKCQPSCLSLNVLIVRRSAGSVMIRYINSIGRVSLIASIREWMLNWWNTIVICYTDKLMAVMELGKLFFSFIQKKYLCFICFDLWSS